MITANGVKRMSVEDWNCQLMEYEDYKQSHEEEGNEKRMIELLEDLYERLVLDYNGDKPFEQMEEDRFAVDEAIELLRGEKE